MTLKQYLDKQDLVFGTYVRGMSLPRIELIDIQTKEHAIPLCLKLSNIIAYQLLTMAKTSYPIISRSPVKDFLTIKAWVTVEYRRIGTCYIKTVYEGSLFELPTLVPIYQEQVPEAELQEDINDTKTILR